MSNGQKKEPDWVSVGNAHEFEPDQLNSRTIKDMPLIFIKSDNHVRCFLDRCSHANIKLSQFGCIHKGAILCHAHGALFDLDSGSASRRPATEPLKAFATKNIDGEIWVLVDSNPDHES